ncbi:hypothetical protein MRX96_005138 [Rhipicephalus microplus]
MRAWPKQPRVLRKTIEGGLLGEDVCPYQLEAAILANRFRKRCLGKERALAGFLDSARKKRKGDSPPGGVTGFPAGAPSSRRNLPRAA